MQNNALNTYADSSNVREKESPSSSKDPILTASETINQLRDLPYELPSDSSNSYVKISEDRNHLLTKDLKTAIETHLHEITRWVLLRRAFRYLQSTPSVPDHENPDKLKDKTNQVFSDFVAYINHPDRLDTWYGEQTDDFKSMLRKALKHALRNAPKTKNPPNTPHTTHQREPDQTHTETPAEPENKVKSNPAMSYGQQSLLEHTPTPQAWSYPNNVSPPGFHPGFTAVSPRPGIKLSAP